MRINGKEYPETSKHCEEYFEKEELQFICGKCNIDGDWILCDECYSLRENKNFSKIQFKGDK